VLYHNQKLGIVLEVRSDDPKPKNWTCAVDTGEGKPRIYRLGDVHPIAELPSDFSGTPQEAFLQFGPQVVADLNTRVESLEYQLEDLLRQIKNQNKKKSE
jgi:hypothetical protein